MVKWAVRAALFFCAPDVYYRLWHIRELTDIKHKAFINFSLVYQRTNILIGVVISTYQWQLRTRVWKI
jgi:hypothetical protein